MQEHEFIAGPYSIADMACYPWIVPYERQGQTLSDFPNIERWFKAIKNRPAVIRAYERAKPYQKANAGGFTEAARKILFGQTSASIKPKT